MNTKKNPAAMYDNVVYAFQGGGALGAYQVGVFRALSEAGYSPNWLTGTSIGAINAAIIAGNPPDQQVAKLQSFWKIITKPNIYPAPLLQNDSVRRLHNFLSAEHALWMGQTGFFKPRFNNPLLHTHEEPHNISFYDVTELRNTLISHIDFDRINSKQQRLSLSVVHVQSGRPLFFDNTKHIIGPEHIMASCALPPGFPAVKVNNEFYWDGGVLGNSPMNAFFEEEHGHNLHTLCFMVHLFDSCGLLPTCLDDVLRREKDISYSSNFRNILYFYRTIYNLRHDLDELRNLLPAEIQQQPQIAKILSAACSSTISLVRLHYTGKPTDLSSKDYEFSEYSINEHMAYGYRDAIAAMASSPWLNEADLHKGVILHEMSEHAITHQLSHEHDLQKED